MGRRAKGTVRIRGNTIQVGYTVSGEGSASRTFFTVAGLNGTKTNLAHVKRNIDEHIRQHVQKSGGTSFISDCQAYLDHAELELSTRNSYRDSLNIYWVPALANRDTLQITFAQINSVDVNTDWTSKKTRRNAICALRGVFKRVYTLQQIPYRTSPAHSMELGKPSRPDPSPYTRDERKLIIDHGGMYEWLAFGTGMRTGELIYLKWSDYDGTRFRVTESRVRSEVKTTKTDTSRNIMVPPWLQTKLSVYPTRWKKSTILLNQYGRSYMRANKLNDQHRKVLAKAGVTPKTGPYPWRHTYASLSLMDGASPEFVAQQLGHSVATLRKNYAKWIEGEYDQQEMDKMSW